MKSSLRTRAAVSAAALLLTFGVAGCEGEDPADPIQSAPEPMPPDSSVSTEPTTTGSTEDPAPLLPIEVVGAWVTAHNSALSTGETDDVVALTGPDCSTCDELRRSVTTVHEAGGYFRGGGWKLDAAAVTKRSADSAIVTTGVTVAAGTTKSDSDAEPSAYPEEKFVAEFEVERAGDRALVTRIVFLP